VQIHGWRTKDLQGPHVGEIALDYSTFAADEQRTLSMMIFRLAASDDAVRIKLSMRQQGKEVP
jgi:hypothetical protein